MKKLFLFATLIFSSFFASAQFAITTGGTAALPVGDLGKISSFGYGGGAGLHYFFQEQGSIGVNVNYYNFMGKDIFPNTTMISVVPTMKFLFFQDDSPYLTIDAGAYFTSNSGLSAQSYGGGLGLGYMYGITDTIALDINAKYTAAYDFDSKSVTMFAPVNIGLLFILGGMW